jgi:tetratricopeptide (TPR) repeat protein
LLSKAYVLAKKLSLNNDKLTPDLPEVVTLIEFINKLNENHQSSAWATFIQAIAIQVLQKRQVEPGNSSPPVALLAKASLLASKDGQFHYVLGNMYTSLVDFSDVPTYVKLVSSELEKCLLLQPSNRELFTHITGIYTEIHDRIQAQDLDEPFWFEELIYKRIIALDPTNAQAHNNLSYLYSTTGVNLQQALREARIANQLKPDSPFFEDTLGWAFYRNGMFKEALIVLHKAVAAEPELADAHFHLASVYYDLDEFDPTVTHFRIAIGLDSSNAFARNNLAYFFAEKNTNLDEALQLVNEAISLSPGNPAFIDTKGWVQYKRGELKEAAELVASAIAMSPETSELYLHLGQIKLGDRNFKEARSAFEKALTFDPGNDDLALKLSRLFALSSLEDALSQFTAIKGVEVNKENYKIFFDLIAQIHQRSGNYDDAANVLKSFGNIGRTSNNSKLTEGASSTDEELESEQDDVIGALEQAIIDKIESAPHRESDLNDDEVPESLKPLTQIDANTPINTEDIKAWSEIISMLDENTGFVAGLSSSTLVKFAAIALEEFDATIPAKLITDLLKSRLPQMTVIGVNLDNDSDKEQAMAVLQFNSISINSLKQQLSSFTGTSVEIPSTGIQVNFSQNIYEGFPLGQIAIKDKNVTYLITKEHQVIISPSGDLITAIADKLKRNEKLTGPKFISSVDFSLFLPEIGKSPDLFTWVNIPGKQDTLRILGLPEKYLKLCRSVRSAGTTYSIVLPDTLNEKTLIFAHNKDEASSLHEEISAFEQEFKTKMSTDSDGKTKVATSFTEEDNKITGHIQIIGIRPWIRKLLGYISKKQSDYEGE